MKRLLAVFLCLSLLLGSVTALAKGFSGSVERSNVTDVDPPEIISITLKENKKTLKPGDVLHVQVKAEDRSNIRSISVSFSNSAKGGYISVWLDYDAATDMYIGEQAIQKSDPNGTYELSQASATDIYGNSLDKYVFSGKECRFKVSGATGSSTVKGSVKVKENGKTLKPGDTLHVEIKTKEAVAGADHATVWFSTEIGTYFGFWCSKKSSTSFSCIREIYKDDINGKWALERVEFCNEYGYEINSMKASGQSFTVTGASGDKTPPVFSNVTLKEKGKTLKPGDTIHVSFKTKDKSTVNYVSASLIENSSSVWDDISGSGEFKSKGSIYLDLTKKSGNKWEGTYKLPKDLPNGKYYLYISAWDSVGNYAYKSFEKLSITFNGPDYVSDGMSEFITVCWNALWRKDPTAAEIQQYGMPLATGKQKASDVILTLLKKSGHTGERGSNALWQIMQGRDPGDNELNKMVELLSANPKTAIDSLNNAVFRQRCKDWGIKPGNLGTGAADTKVTTVDVDGGHYTLNGSKATLTGVTDKNIKKLVVKDTVSANGKTYKVTQIDKAACRGLKKLTTVTIGKNVTSIGAEAFNGCKKLKTITVNATNLKKVGINAFAGIKNSATFKCPKKKLSKYEKLIREKGNAPKKAKFK